MLVASGTASCLLLSALWAGPPALSRCSGPTSWDQEVSCQGFSTLWKHTYLLCRGRQGWEPQGALSQVAATQRFVPEWTVGRAKTGGSVVENWVAGGERGLGAKQRCIPLASWICGGRIIWWMGCLPLRRLSLLICKMGWDSIINPHSL